MGFWGSVSKIAGQVVGTKGGIWYPKKKKKVDTKAFQDRRKEVRPEDEKAIADAMDKERKKKLAMQGKSRIDFGNKTMLG